MQFFQWPGVNRIARISNPRLLVASIVFGFVAISNPLLDSGAIAFAQEQAAKPTADKPETLLGWLVESLGWGYILVFLHAFVHFGSSVHHEHALCQTGLRLPTSFGRRL